MREIRGKNALITGAASGIGRALAIALANEGANLFLLDINESELHQTIEFARPSDVDLTAHRCDLSNPSDIQVAVARVKQKWNSPDILINNAGVCYYGPTTQMRIDQWEWLLSINLLAGVRLVHAFLPGMSSKPEAHIVNISSIYGLVTSRHNCAYHVSKFGLLGFSQALRTEFNRRGLGVTAVCPGFVDTTLFDTMICDKESRRKSPPGWFATTPEHVARKTIQAIRRNKRIVVTPLHATIMYYGNRFFPGLIDWVAGMGRKRRIQRKLESRPDIVREAA